MKQHQGNLDYQTRSPHQRCECRISFNQVQFDSAPHKGGNNSRNSDRLQPKLFQFHAVLYIVHRMELTFPWWGRLRVRRAQACAYSWSYGHGTIYRADWNRISASSCIRKHIMIYQISNHQHTDTCIVALLLYAVDRTPRLSSHLPACQMEQWAHPILEPSFLVSQSLLSQPGWSHRAMLQTTQFQSNPLRTNSKLVKCHTSIKAPISLSKLWYLLRTRSSREPS
jgi:hypothetical protein